MLVIKRDSREVPFEPLKIKNAIMNSFNEMYDEVTDDMTACAEKITSDISALNKTLSVEEIQDMVEKKLMASKYKGVAKCYINYRYLHKMVRDKYGDFMEAVSHKLNADDVQNQNANVDEYSFGGRIGEAADIMTKRFALDYIVSPMARKNHEENMIYIHDLNSYAVGSHNCLSIPFDELLANGFNTRQTDVRPAQSINTAFQLVAVIFQIQSLQQFGGVSATHLDWTMVPYVRKSFFKHYIIAYLKDNEEFNNIDLMEMLFDTYTDNIGVVRNRFDDWIDAHKTEFFNKTNLSIEDFYFNNDKLHPKYRQSALYDTIIECQQAVEGMYHNLNTLQSRSGNQLPFTSINYGTCTLSEGRMVTKAILDVSIKGLGKLHKTSIFPCGIFQCMKGVNRKEGDPNYDLFKLALRSTSQRLYPNYANCDVGTQMDWVRFDRQSKEKIINELSPTEYQTLIERLEENPELKDILMLDVIDE